MKNSQKVFFVLLACLFALSCEEEKKETNLDTKISFEVTRSNSGNNYNSKADGIIDPVKKESRFLYGSDSVELIQEISFHVRLENGDTLSFGFWLKGNEGPKLLNLGAYDPNYFKGVKWDYKNFDDEVENFYRDFREARVLINNNVIVQIGSSENNFKVIKAKEVILEGEKKTHIEIRFEGTAYGWYDPNGIMQEVFKISNGIYKGVME